MNERIEIAIIDSGKTKSAIAAECGVAPSSVTQWINGASKTMKPDNLYALAKSTGYCAEWLGVGKGPRKPAEPSPHNPVREKGGFYESSNVAAGPDLQGAFPVISWVQAGSWSEVVDHADITEEWIPCPGKCGKYSYVLRVSGESMFDPAGRKSFKDGDLIFVDPEKQAENGSLVVVKMTDDETATFKQLMIEENGTRYLKALNPSWPNRIMQINGNATICGVVTYKVEPM